MGFPFLGLLLFEDTAGVLIWMEMFYLQNLFVLLGIRNAGFSWYL
jgi:hypothetical protein